MTELNALFFAKLHYFCREKYWHHVGEISSEGLNRFVNEPQLQFLYAFSLFMEGRLQESIREFDAIKDNADVALAVLTALSQVHRSFKNVDKEAVSEIETSLRDVKRSSSIKAVYFTGLFYYYTDKLDRAKEFVDRAVKDDTSNSDYLALKGWLELHIGRDMKVCTKYFDDAIDMSENKVYPDAMLGKTKYFELRQNQSSALQTISQASIQHPNFLPIWIEKMKIQLSVKEWEQAYETAQRCNIIDSGCLPALEMVTLFTIAHLGQAYEAASMVHDIIQEIDRSEPKNTGLMLNFAKLFSRSCGRTASILQHTISLCNNAVERNQENSAEAKIELGHQYRMKGDNRNAARCFNEALSEGTDNISALVGLITCHVATGEVKEAKSQIDFLKETESKMENLIEMQFVEVFLSARQKTVAPHEIVTKIGNILEMHLNNLSKLSFGFQYFVELNIDLLIELTNVLFVYAPSEPTTVGDPALKLAITILTVIVEAAHGHTEALYLLGKAKYLSRNLEPALAALQQCLAKDQSFAEAHLLSAQIYTLQDNFKLASQSLEVGVSFNFEIREHPLYHLIKARIQKRSNDVNTAILTLEGAMKLRLFKEMDLDASTSKVTSRSKLELTDSDRLAVYLELIDCYQSINRLGEASILMQEATKKFQGTDVEQQLLLSNAELALGRGETDRAITLLKSISSEMPNYFQARQKLADIYLHHKKDKRQFALCYRELVEKNPTPQAFVLLGDAYMNVQEPERAIEMFETALKKNPKDHQLARKIGQAYVKSHQFTKAVNYYEAALKTGQQSYMRHDLAELLLKLKKYEKCEKILKQGLEKQLSNTGGGSDVQSMIDDVKLMVLLAKVYVKTVGKEQAVQTLFDAKELQIRVIKRGPIELADAFGEQKKLAARICCQLAEYYQHQRDFDKAIKYYQEALTYSENDSKIMMSLAHLYLLLADLDACNQQCMQLLKVDKDNDQATLMLADLMYQKNEVDTAMFHFQHLLDRNPCQYYALARLVELFWRNGELDMAERYIKQAEISNQKAVMEPGFNYSRGIYEWYSGDPNSALQTFNKARRDPEWGERALYSMIDICLNPDNQIVGGVVFEQGDAVDNTSGYDHQEASEIGVRTAQNFLQELQYRGSFDEYRILLLENFVRLATRNKGNIEEALHAFLGMIGGEEEETLNVGAILGSARAYQLLKQTPKAKAQLKRVIGHPWNFEDAEYLEQCWLLLADLYINQNKYDVATEILKTSLQHNGSCLKAYEYMGFIREKEQNWTDAAMNYEQAWKLGKKKNPAIGYKLAFNYLKSRRFVEAIDVSHFVLKAYPNYPKIRKDIMDKARASLRM